MIGLEALLPRLACTEVGEVRPGESEVRVSARTREGRPLACPACGTGSSSEHSRYTRRVTDEAVGGRPVVVDLSVRRLYCREIGCPRVTFVEQVDGLTVRYQRRTPALQRVVDAVAVALAGRAGARLLTHLHHTLSSTTVLSGLMAIPVPDRPTPQVLGVDDFALRRGHRYATILIDAVTHDRVDVLPDRRAETLAAWLRAHPGVTTVCRDGSAAYAQAIGDALPDAVQVSDRWHLWSNLGAAVEKTVTAHAGCWRAETGRATPGSCNQRTLDRHTAVHTLLAEGVGLLETGRRLGLSLNTVKRYARAPAGTDLLRPPAYRACLVDPYRDHLHQRRSAGPVSGTVLLAEIRAMGYTGSANLLGRYLSQGRADDPLPPPTVRRLTAWIMTDPARLPPQQHAHLDKLTTACPEMTALAAHVTAFARLITRRDGGLQHWIDAVTADDLPTLHAFARGLNNDRAAVDAGLSLPYSNGPTEGTNTKIKLLKRQTYGRAGFTLLRQRILLS